MELRQPYRISCYRSEPHCTRGIAAKFDVFKTTQVFAEMGAQTDARDFPIVIVEGPNGWRKKLVHGMPVEGGPFLVQGDMN